MESSFPAFVVLGAFVIGAACGGGFVAWTLRLRRQDETVLAERFKALAADTLYQNSALFLTLAEERLKEGEKAAVTALGTKEAAIEALVKPMRETLERMDTHVRALESKREGAYRELLAMVAASREGQKLLQKETGQLLQALRAPSARGRWGEIQLRRILEITGLAAHIGDFTTQAHIVGEDSNARPDCIVHLPGARCVVIDSKVPLMAYLDSVEATTEEARLEGLGRHAKQLKQHVRLLGAKGYGSRVEGAPEFVVLFLPGEHFLSAALEADPGLLDYSAENNVVLTTPTTLVALLRMVAWGWRQEALAANVREVADAGRKLREALEAFLEPLGKVGRQLALAGTAYNKAMDLLGRSVLDKAEVLSALGAGSADERPLMPPPRVRIARAPRGEAWTTESADEDLPEGDDSSRSPPPSPSGAIYP